MSPELHHPPPFPDSPTSCLFPSDPAHGQFLPGSWCCVPSTTLHRAVAQYYPPQCHVLCTTLQLSGGLEILRNIRLARLRGTLRAEGQGTHVPCRRPWTPSQRSPLSLQWRVSELRGGRKGHNFQLSPAQEAGSEAPRWWRARRGGSRVRSIVPGWGCRKAAAAGGVATGTWECPGTALTHRGVYWELPQPGGMVRRLQSWKQEGNRKFGGHPPQAASSPRWLSLAHTGSLVEPAPRR